MYVINIMTMYIYMYIFYHSACRVSYMLWSMLPPSRRPQTWIICLTIPSFPWHPNGMWARSAWRTTWHVNSPFGRRNSLPILGIATCTHDVLNKIKRRGPIIPTSSTKKTHTGKTPQHTTKRTTCPRQQELFRPLQPAHSRLLYLRRTTERRCLGFAIL